MMRSMYAGVSGLRVHQNKMDVIGNNIANVNTVAFKRGQMTFQEVFNETVRGASAPQAGKGGTNPQQIGLGVGVGSTNVIHTKGALQTTGNATDLMIDGEGFFVVSDDSNFENRYYTRAGNFTLDRDGNLVTSEGHKVLGYQTDAEGNITSEIGAIRINKSETKAPTATDNIEFRGNLDSEATGSHITDTVIYDSLGNSYTISFKFTKAESERTWELTVDRITQQSTGNYTEDLTHIFGEGVSTLRLEFDSYGRLGKIIKVGGDGENSEEFMIPGEFSISLEGLSGIEFNYNSHGDPLDDATTPVGNLEDINIFNSDNRDTYRHLTQYANDMDAKSYAMNGNTSGKLDGYSIGPDGLVEGIFTNGERKALGQVMLAKFDNVMGLEKLGNNLYSNTRNSGEPQLGRAGSSGYGPIASGSLEMSNVDLSMEFTEMITTQRGFQANSRIITTSDEMLQELVNIKR